MRMQTNTDKGHRISGASGLRGLSALLARLVLGLFLCAGAGSAWADEAPGAAAASAQTAPSAASPAERGWTSGNASASRNATVAPAVHAAAMPR